MALSLDALEVLRRTSRTFYIPIVRLPEGLRDAVGSAYLCMRAIDEIEDHEHLPARDKQTMLEAVGRIFMEAADTSTLSLARLDELFIPYRSTLPQVTLNVGHYGMMAPEPVAMNVWRSTAEMAQRMAYWAQSDWPVHTEKDLDDYTFDVAGRVGLLLNELWAWYDGTEADPDEAVSFGRGLQSVNILRNRREDLERGADFYPDGWTNDDLHRYVIRQLDIADAYVARLPAGPVREFCQLPLVLARGTQRAIQSGLAKLSRPSVMRLVDQCIGGGGPALQSVAGGREDK